MYNNGVGDRKIKVDVLFYHKVKLVCVFFTIYAIGTMPPGLYPLLGVARVLHSIYNIVVFPDGSYTCYIIYTI